MLHSQEFYVGVKMGLFMEIFYSPYDDEVMELFISPRDDLHAYDAYVVDKSSDDEGDYIESSQNLKKYEMNKYASSKTIWVDLEPGYYTTQILCYRHVKGKQV